MRRLVLRLVASAISVSALSVSTLLLLSFLFPFPLELIEQFPSSAVVTDRDHTPLRIYRTSTDELRIPVPLAEISPWLVEATIAVEDRRFRSHCGVDPLAALRAVWQNLRRGAVHSGASTLPMQLVRIVEPRPRTLWSKAVESFYALQIDARLEKDEVVEAYLNLAPYGGDLRGVGAAAQRYFGKRARDLGLAESALLAGLPQSPSRLRPDRYYERSLARREVVLDAMLRAGVIDAAERARASAERPAVRRHAWPFRAPHFADVALREGRGRATDGHGPRLVASTLDSCVQSCAEARVAEALSKLAPSPGGAPAAALVVVEARSGAVRALVGSGDYFDDTRRGQLNAALARRSPGSALKPFLYAVAFDRGLASPSSYLADVPAPFAAYVPENFDGRYHGPVPASEALALSYNVPAVRLLQAVGITEFLRVLRRLGLETLDRDERHYGLTLALGGGEVRLLELASAYAALVRGGVFVRPSTIAGASPGPHDAVFSPGAARLVLEALSSDEHLRRALGKDRRPGAPRLGYKTGTSFGRRDAWCVAFSSEYVVGVWLGEPSGRARADLVGVEVAAPLALAVAEEISGAAAAEWGTERGAGEVFEIEVCALSGYLPGRACPSRKRGRACASTLRLPTCPVHRQVLVDEAGGVEVCARCARGRTGRVSARVVEEWPPGVERWLRSVRRAPARLSHDPACPSAARGGDLAARAPRILSPAEGARFRRLAAAPFAQRLALAASAAPDAERLFWFVDGELVASASALEEAVWELRAGRHQVRCVDERGRGAAASFVVER